MTSNAQDAVLVELRALRKRSEGVTVDALAALAPTTCRLLGNGDAYVAFTRLQHHLLDEAHERSIKAAAASLGFASDQETHLSRLEDAGQALHVDQRHARRLSDAGLAMLANLIVTNWLVETVPELRVTVVRDPDGWMVTLATTCPLAIEMRDPEVVLYVGSESKALPVALQDKAEPERLSRTLSEPLRVGRAEAEISIAVTWKGEVWPKFTCALLGNHDSTVVETLGNRLMVRLA